MKDSVIEEIKRQCGTVRVLNNGWCHFVYHHLHYLNIPDDANGMIRISIPHVVSSKEYEKEEVNAAVNETNREVKFIKAYLHIWLFQLYGPIPFVDVNIPVDASPEEVKVVREPVDDVVAKIVALLDEAISSNALPEYIRSRDTELGRITKPGAMAIKARLLTYAASPLYNGNEDFAGWKDAEGRNMINPEYDATKWEIARDACKEAIDAAIAAGHELYEFDEPVKNISDTTRLELTLRHTLTKKFSDELLWGLGRRNTRDLTGISNAPGHHTTSISISSTP